MVIVLSGPGNHIATGYRYGVTEMVVIRPIAGCQFGHFLPVATTQLEDIGRTGTVIVTMGPYDGIVARYAYMTTEIVKKRPVTGCEFGGFRPCPIAALENIRRSGLRTIVIIFIGPYDGILPGYGY